MPFTAHAADSAIRLLTRRVCCTEMAIHLDGSKARRVLGYKPARPLVQVDELKTIAQGFQKDNIW